MTPPFPDPLEENDEGAAPAQPAQLLVVGAQQDAIRALRAQLVPKFDLKLCVDAEHAGPVAASRTPDICLVCASELDSPAIGPLRKVLDERQVPFVILTDGPSPNPTNESPALGGWDVINTVSDMPFLQARLCMIMQLNRRVQQSIELHNARWRFALDSADFGVRDFDLKTGKMNCSPTLSKMLGLAAMEQEATQADWLQWTHPEDRERVETAHRRLQTGEHAAVEIEYRLTGNRRTPIWIHERSRILQWEGGVPRSAMAVVTNTTEQRSSEHRLVKLTNYDLLTDLPNRTKCLQFLSETQVRTRITGFAACLFRINVIGLSHANQSLGRVAGDEVLKQVASRLKAFVENPEHVCRLGGKEFALVGGRLGVGDTHSKAASIALDIARELQKPYQLGDKTLACACVVGACIVNEKLDDPEEMIRRAEIAIDDARSAKTPTAVFHQEMLDRVEIRSRLLHDLKSAVFSDAFQVVYQPIVERSGRIIAVEALARWHHPERGTVPASEFLPLAESSGLIVPLGARLRRLVCEQMSGWAQNPTTSRLAVAVNVSPIEFRARGFVRDLLLLIRSKQIDPSLLLIELSESLLTGDFEEISRHLTELRDAGVRLVLSDFGTGYSSLTYLKRLPIEMLKLDRSFVRDILTDPVDASVSRAILAMAHNLGLEVIAEGVEDESQARLLSEMGCSLYQGYLFGRPSDAPQIEQDCARPAESLLPRYSRRRAFSLAPNNEDEVDVGASILVVDDDHTTLQLLTRILKEYPNVRATADPLEAKQMAEEAPPDLILLDTQMPKLNGFQLWEGLRKNPALADVPAIFVTAFLDPETELRALSMGAADFVSKPISAARLKLAVRNQVRLKRQTDSLKHQASLDPLTEVANRRSFDRALSREVARAIEAASSVSLLMVDVDHFKLVNDECGHPAGDRCLVSVARVLARVVSRPMDLVARYGGEEFAIVLPLTDEAEAAGVARRIVEGIASTSFREDLDDPRQITVSVGFATLHGQIPTEGARAALELLEQADRALFSAKEQGRNQACGPKELILPMSGVARN